MFYMYQIIRNTRNFSAKTKNLRLNRTNLIA